MSLILLVKRISIRLLTSSKVNPSQLRCNNLGKPQIQNFHPASFAKTWAWKRTKDFYAESLVYGTEETIKKLNKPPCDKKCNGYRKEYHAANNQKLTSMLLK